MHPLTVLLPIDVLIELKRQAAEQGLLVAELAGLILHAALIERSQRTEQVNHD